MDGKGYRNEVTYGSNMTAIQRVPLKAWGRIGRVQVREDGDTILEDKPVAGNSPEMHTIFTPSHSHGHHTEFNRARTP